MSFLLYLLIALGLASCASNGPVFHATEEGRVYADDPLTGLRIERALLRFGPAVRERLGVEEGAGTPDVYFQEPGCLRWGRSPRRLRTARVVLDETEGANLEYLVAHGLVHWYLPHSVFVRLPLFAQEGLAAYVGHSFFPPFQDQWSRAARWWSAPVLPSYLYLDEDGWSQLSADERTKLSRLALDVVYQIGLEKLREICEQGDPSIPSLLEHAKLYYPAPSAPSGQAP